MSFVCKVCESEFSSKQRLQGHEEKGICLGKAYLCVRCLNIFESKYRLDRHQGSNRKCKKVEKVMVIRDENDKLVTKVVKQDDDNE